MAGDRRAEGEAAHVAGNARSGDGDFANGILLAGEGGSVILDSVIAELGRMRTAILSMNDRIRDADDRAAMRRAVLDAVELCERRIKDLF